MKKRSKTRGPKAKVNKPCAAGVGEGAQLVVEESTSLKYLQVAPDDRPSDSPVRPEWHRFASDRSPARNRDIVPPSYRIPQWPLAPYLDLLSSRLKQGRKSADFYRLIYLAAVYNLLYLLRIQTAAAVVSLEYRVHSTAKDVTTQRRITAQVALLTSNPSCSLHHDLLPQSEVEAHFTECLQLCPRPSQIGQVLPVL